MGIGRQQIERTRIGDFDDARIFSLSSAFPGNLISALFSFTKFHSERGNIPFLGYIE
jgi:hypothetical protein